MCVSVCERECGKRVKWEVTLHRTKTDKNTAWGRGDRGGDVSGGWK